MHTSSPDSAALTPSEKRLEATVEVATLSAFYGALLTAKQREALRLHCEEDLSLGEIAEQMNVSRQNVHELIARSSEKLRAYEAALGAASRMRDILGGLDKARELLKAAQAQALPPKAAAAVSQADSLIETIIQKQEEDDHGV